MLYNKAADGPRLLLLLIFVIFSPRIRSVHIIDGLTGLLEIVSGSKGDLIGELLLVCVNEACWDGAHGRG